MEHVCNLYFYDEFFCYSSLSLQGWDFESIDTADSNSDSSKFELEPMNEMVIGHNVRLSSVVKSSTPDSFLWFAKVRGQEVKGH